MVENGTLGVKLGSAFDTWYLYGQRGYCVSGEQKKSMLSNYSNKVSKFRK
jgi:hypothetical protein